MSVRIESLDEGRVSFTEPDVDKEAIDPVCGMTVDRQKAGAMSTERDGTVYYFCSRDCRDRFLEEPEAYI